LRRLNMSSFNSFGPNITAADLCRSVLGQSTDSAAIKFMKLAPSMFPQFIKPSHGNHGHDGQSLNGDALVPPPPSDSDTTQSMDTVYSQDDIKAAKQLLNMHSFATVHSTDGPGDLHRPKCWKSKSGPSSIGNQSNHCGHSSHSRFDLEELQCLDASFTVHSPSISRLDRMVRSGQLSADDLGSRCRRCGQQFASKVLLSEHLQRAHDLYFCVKCKAMYASLSELDEHKCKGSKWRRTRSAVGERPFRCKICLKTFVSKGNWKRHSLVHNGQRRVHCRFCGKGYIQKWRHRKHEQQCGG